MPFDARSFWGHLVSGFCFSMGSVGERRRVVGVTHTLGLAAFFTLGLINEVASQDLPPPTPDYSDREGHLHLATGGIGALEAHARWPGADGTGIRIAVLGATNPVLDHEDLRLPAAIVVGPVSRWGSTRREHETAVFGLLRAMHNEYGVNGIVPKAELLYFPDPSPEPGGSARNAAAQASERIGNAAARLKAGDILLIEQGLLWANDYTGEAVCNGAQVPWDSDWISGYPRKRADAIRAAIARGITVVQGAGHVPGQAPGFNLDDRACRGAFDRNRFDSGAIVVAASNPDHSLHHASNYGNRVDLHAWGDATTVGYRHLWDGDGDVRQRYGIFGLTSCAAAIVAGAAAAVQGARLRAGLPPFRPKVLRRLLRATGTAQSSQPEHIGPQPNLVAAINTALTCEYTSPRSGCRGRCAAGQACRAQLYCSNSLAKRCYISEDCCDARGENYGDCVPTACACAAPACGVSLYPRCSGGACAHGTCVVSNPLIGNPTCSCRTDSFIRHFLRRHRRR